MHGLFIGNIKHTLGDFIFTPIFIFTLELEFTCDFTFTPVPRQPFNNAAIRTELNATCTMGKCTFIAENMVAIFGFNWVANIKVVRGIPRAFTNTQHTTKRIVPDSFRHKFFA